MISSLREIQFRVEELSALLYLLRTVNKQYFQILIVDDMVAMAKNPDDRPDAEALAERIAHASRLSPGAMETL